MSDNWQKWVGNSLMTGGGLLFLIPLYESFKHHSSQPQSSDIIKLPPPPSDPREFQAERVDESGTMLHIPPRIPDVEAQLPLPLDPRIRPEELPGIPFEIRPRTPPSRIPINPGAAMSNPSRLSPAGEDADIQATDTPRQRTPNAGRSPALGSGDQRLPYSLGQAVDEQTAAQQASIRGFMESQARGDAAGSTTYSITPIIIKNSIDIRNNIPTITDVYIIDPQGNAFTGKSDSVWGQDLNLKGWSIAGEVPIQPARRPERTAAAIPYKVVLTTLRLLHLYAVMQNQYHQSFLFIPNNKFAISANDALRLDDLFLNTPELNYQWNKAGLAILLNSRIPENISRIGYPTNISNDPERFGYVLELPIDSVSNINNDIIAQTYPVMTYYGGVGENINYISSNFSDIPAAFTLDNYSWVGVTNTLRTTEFGAMQSLLKNKFVYWSSAGNVLGIPANRYTWDDSIFPLSFAGRLENLQIVMDDAFPINQYPTDINPYTLWNFLVENNSTSTLAYLYSINAIPVENQISYDFFFDNSLIDTRVVGFDMNTIEQLVGYRGIRGQSRFQQKDTLRKLLQLFVTLHARGVTQGYMEFLKNTNGAIYTAQIFADTNAHGQLVYHFHEFTNTRNDNLTYDMSWWVDQIRRRAALQVERGSDSNRQYLGFIGLISNPVVDHQTGRVVYIPSQPDEYIDKEKDLVGLLDRLGREQRFSPSGQKIMEPGAIELRAFKAFTSLLDTIRRIAIEPNRGRQIEPNRGRQMQDFNVFAQRFRNNRYLQEYRNHLQSQLSDVISPLGNLFEDRTNLEDINTYLRSMEEEVEKIRRITTPKIDYLERSFWNYYRDRAIDALALPAAEQQRLGLDDKLQNLQRFVNLGRFEGRVSPRILFQPNLLGQRYHSVENAIGLLNILEFYQYLLNQFGRMSIDYDVHRNISVIEHYARLPQPFQLMKERAERGEIMTTQQLKEFYQPKPEWGRPLLNLYNEKYNTLWFQNVQRIFDSWLFIYRRVQRLLEEMSRLDTGNRDPHNLPQSIFGVPKIIYGDGILNRDLDIYSMVLD